MEVQSQSFDHPASFMKGHFTKSRASDFSAVFKHFTEIKTFCRGCCDDFSSSFNLGCLVSRWTVITLFFSKPQSFLIFSSAASHFLVNTQLLHCQGRCSLNIRNQTTTSTQKLVCSLCSATFLWQFCSLMRFVVAFFQPKDRTDMATTQISCQGGKQRQTVL